MTMTKRIPYHQYGGHDVRNSTIAERSHMPPDQQAYSPHIAQWRPPSPVACSPLAPAYAIFSCSSLRHARHRVRSVRHSAGFNFVCLIDIHWGSRPPAIYAPSLSGDDNKGGVICF